MAYDFNSLTKQADEASNRDKFYTDFGDVDPNKLHQISELTDWMRTKAKGSDVREIIAQLFERTWLEGTKEGNANLEVAQARGNKANLSERLNLMENEIDAANTATIGKVDKNGASQINYNMLAQDVREKFTGGSVAVVGVDSVNKSNLCINSVTKNKLDPSIQDLLSESFVDIPLTFTDVGWHHISGVANTDAGYHKTSIPVTPGEIYKLSGYSYLALRPYLFADSTGAIVGYYPVAETKEKTFFEDMVINIPNNVSTLLINKIDGNFPVSLKKVSGFKIDGRKVDLDLAVAGKQIYDTSMLVHGKWLTPEGTIGTEANSKYAKIPVQPNEIVSLCRNDSRTFASNTSGSLQFLDSGGKQISYINPADYVSPKKYNGFNYITFTTPTNCAYILYTTKLNTAYDIGSTLFVTYGAEITTELLANNEIYKINGAAVRDVVARNLGNTSSKPYTGVEVGFLGDSLTEKNSRTTKHYHDYIAEDLGLTNVNLGRSGTGYMRTWDEGFAFYQRVSTIPATVKALIVFGSFNDLGGGFALGEITDSGTSTICGCINTFFDNYYAKFPTTPIGIITPTPWDTKHPGTSNADNYVSKLIQICEKRSVPCLDLYHNSNLRPWDSTFRTLAYSKDDGHGVHPDENGHKIIYPKIREFLKSLI